MMNNYTTQTTQDKPLTVTDTAAEIFSAGLIPVQLCRPSTTKKEGKEASQAAWNKLETYNDKYNSKEDVQSTFRGEDGVGLLLGINGLCVLDIDKRSIANHKGLRIAELFVNTSKNVFGRKHKHTGAILLRTDADMSHYKTLKGEVEVLCNSSNKHQQKVLPPSTIYDKKAEVFDMFEFRTPHDYADIEYVAPDRLKAVCNFIALADIINEHYPHEGSRDSAMLCLARVLSLSPYEFVNTDFINSFMDKIAENAGDNERAGKTYNKHLAQVAEQSVDNPKWQLKKYFDQEIDADYMLKLLGVSEETIAEEEVVERVPNFSNASDFEVEDLPAQDWVAYRMLPRGDLTIHAGDGGTGKTMHAIQMGLMSDIPNAYFHKMFPYGNKPWNTYLVSNEDPDRILKIRTAVIKKGLREMYPDYTGNFSNFTFESFKANPLKLVRKKRNGMPEVNHKDLKYLSERIGDLKIDSVILDPMSTLHVGMNENDNAEMDWFTRHGIIAPLCEKLYVNVQLIAHVAKGTNNNNDDIQSSSWALRGASSQMAAARVGVTYNRMTQKKIKEILGKDAPKEAVFNMQKDYVHITYGKNNNASVTQGTYLRKKKLEYKNNDNKTIDSIILIEDRDIDATIEDQIAQVEQEKNLQRQSVFKTILQQTKTSIRTSGSNEAEWPLIDAAKIVMHHCPHMKSIRTQIRANAPSKEDKDIAKSIANRLELIFQKPWKHPEYNVQLSLIKKDKRTSTGTIKRWLVLRDVEDIDNVEDILFKQTIKDNLQENNNE